MTDPRLEITVLPRRAATRLVLRGELDLASAPSLSHTVSDVYDRGVRHLVVDLRDLSFVDAAGLHVLDAIDRDARANGHNASFVRSGHRVHRTFGLVGLADRLVFVDDPDELTAPADPAA